MKRFLLVITAKSDIQAILLVKAFCATMCQHQENTAFIHCESAGMGRKVEA